MSRSRLSRRRFSFPWFWRHLCMPFVAAEPFRVLNLDRNGRSQGAPMTHATNKGDDILFKTLTLTAAIAQATASKFIFNVGSQDSGRWERAAAHLATAERIATAELLAVICRGRRCRRTRRAQPNGSAAGGHAAGGDACGSPPRGTAAAFAPARAQMDAKGNDVRTYQTGRAAH